jgi:hypothetical protein
MRKNYPDILEIPKQITYIAEIKLGKKRFAWLSVITPSEKTDQFEVQQCVGLRPLGAPALPNGDIIHV